MVDSTIHGAPLAEANFGPLTLGGFVREVCRRNGDKEAMVFYPPDRSLHGGLPSVASAASAGAQEGPPDRKPVVRYTYAQLWDEAFAIAQALVARGVTKETRVGLLATNRPEWVTALFGIALAGGTCVALSTFAKSTELEYALRVGDVSILFLERSVLNRDFAAEVIGLCPELATSKDVAYSTSLPFLRRVICIDDGPAPQGAFESWRDFVRTDRKVSPALIDAIDAEVTPTDRSMVFFSSGSTAKPKAIVHTHRAAAIQCWRWADIAAIDPHVRTWAANGFFWSGNFSQVMGATLAAGGCLVLQRFFDPAEALQLMQIEKVSYPVAWPHQWVRLVDEPTYNQTDLSAMKYVAARSPLRDHPTVKTDWQEPMSAYGNSETLTLNAAHYSGTAPEVCEGNHGFPLHGNTIRIVDPLSGKVLGRNENGEIAVKGPTMMLGYLRLASEETFDEEGFFRTGDGGFVDDQGRLHWLGRLNDIIKTGGANVSPQEIDEVLRKCPGVKISATVGIPHDTLGEMVVACIVREEGSTVDESAVRAFASKQLSSYKVPRKVLFVEEADLTLTATNKVKTAPLRELATRRLSTDNA